MVCQIEDYIFSVFTCTTNRRLLKLVNLCAMLLELHRHMQPKSQWELALSFRLHTSPCFYSHNLMHTRLAVCISTVRMYTFGLTQGRAVRWNSTLDANSSGGFWQCNDRRVFNMICTVQKCHPEAQNCSIDVLQVFFLIHFEIKSNVYP